MDGGVGRATLDNVAREGDDTLFDTWEEAWHVKSRKN